ncbi:MAG: glycosyltransferase family 87 protein [Thermomicrobiales bacterium]
MDAAAAVILLGAAAGFALAFGEAWGWSPGLFVARVLHGAAALAALVALARLALLVADWLPGGATVTGNDFGIFYRAGEAARTQSPLYDLAALRRDSGEVVAYRHAPVGAVLFVPWTFLPYRLALHSWQALNIALYAATLWGLLRHFGVSWRGPLALALAAIWAASVPSADSLGLGQWDALFLSLFLTLLTVLTMRRDRDLLGGAFLALPIALKFFPVLLLLGPLVARRWRIFAGCALGGAILLAVGLLAGPENTRTFVRDVVPEVGGGTLYAENQTLYAFVGRLLAPSLARPRLRHGLPPGTDRAAGLCAGGADRPDHGAGGVAARRRQAGRGPALRAAPGWPDDHCQPPGCTTRRWRCCRWRCWQSRSTG